MVLDCYRPVLSLGVRRVFIIIPLMRPQKERGTLLNSINLVLTLFKYFLVSVNPHPVPLPDFRGEKS